MYCSSFFLFSILSSYGGFTGGLGTADLFRHPQLARSEALYIDLFIVVVSPALTALITDGKSAGMIDNFFRAPTDRTKGLFRFFVTITLDRILCFGETFTLSSKFVSPTTCKSRPFAPVSLILHCLRRAFLPGNDLHVFSSMMHSSAPVSASASTSNTSWLSMSSCWPINEIIGELQFMLFML